jgi:hypothetical protein
MMTRAPMAWSRGLFVIVFGAALLWTSSAGAAETDMATGTMTVAGKTYKLAHVYTRRQPDMNDKTKTVVVVLLTDNAVPKNIVDDRFRLELTDLAREGKIHGVSVTLGLDKKPSGTGWTYAKEFGGAIVNRADQNIFSPAVFNDTRIEGKLSGTGTFGDQKWEYAATVKAAVATLK